MFTSLSTMFILDSSPPPSLTCLPVYLPCFLFPPTCLPVYSPCLLFISPPRHVYQFTLHVYYFFPLPDMFTSLSTMFILVSSSPPPPPRHVYQFIYHVSSSLQHVYQFTLHVYYSFPLPDMFTSLLSMFIIFFPPRHVYQFIHHVYSCLFLPPPLPDMFTSLSTMFPLPSNMFTSLLFMFIIFFPSPTCLPVYPPCLVLSLPPPPLPRHVYQFIYYVSYSL